jgi:hypothetical protein
LTIVVLYSARVFCASGISTWPIDGGCASADQLPAPKKRKPGRLPKSLKAAPASPRTETSP